MTRYRIFFNLTLLLASLPGPVWTYTLPDVEPALPETTLPETPEGAPGVTADWWSTVQKDIRQSEYDVTWQEHTDLADGDAAYQAPNRAHNLRTTFTPAGVRLTPRLFEGQIPPWEWGLALSGYGYADSVQPVAAATLTASGNRIEYERGLLTEWYVNDERGLEQGFTLHTPPESAVANPKSEIVLDLALSGNLIATLNDDGQTIEFTTSPSTSGSTGSPQASEQGGRVRVLCYGELAVVDAAGRQLPTRLSLSPLGKGRGEGGIRIAFDATAALYPVTVDPLATEPAWTAEGDQDYALFGYSVGTVGDVNGDGYADVVVGAHWYNNGQADEGRAFVYHGSVAGLSTTPAWTAEGDQDSAKFGYSVGAAGDVNGDGYADVVVGAPWYDDDQTNEGRAFVYYGSVAGLSTTPAWIAESDQEGACFGYSVGTAGDVNGDGYADVIVGANGYDDGQTNEGRAFVYHGSVTGLSPTPAWTAAEGDQDYAQFGYSVGTAGDVNGDGYADVVVGAYSYDNGQAGEGRAFVYHGSASGLSTTPAWTAEGDQDDASFGISVGTAGDVNGDGYADVIIGANGYTNGQTDEGRAFVYHGSTAGLSATPAWTAEGDQESASFGLSVGTAGDVNGDGYADVIVGAPWYDNDPVSGGRVFVYHGSVAGLSATPAWTAEGDQDNAKFGISAGTAGDVNGDGYADVVVGAPGYDNGQTDEGRAFVYHGSASGLSTIPAWIAEGDQEGACFGISVGTAGDVNGDGYADVVVGAHGYDDGQTNEGRAFVYHGSAAGLSTTSAWTAEGDQEGACFGISVGTAGDVNGDGYADVVVGAHGYDDGQTNEGRAFVYHGSVTGLSSNSAWTVEGDQDYAQFGYSVGTAGDVNGDGYADVIVGASYYDQTDEGQAFVYHGSASGLSTTPAWTAEGDQAEARFGHSVGTAGDVNSDGYADVIVGAYGYDDGQTNEGRVFVYHGSAAGLFSNPTWSKRGNQEDACFGISVGTAGDVNGDGYADVIIGANGYDDGQTNEGRAFVYHGSAATLSSIPAWTAEGDQDYALFGYSVGTAGDVNGDGYADVIVGAYGYDDDQTDEGRASLYYGNGGDGLHLLPRQMRTDGADPPGPLAPIAPLGMSDSDTSFQLSLIGRSPAGREDVRLQWQVAPLGTSFSAAGVISGTSGWTDVLTAGVEITQTVSGLMPETPYHWRVRLLYRPGNALGLPASRWIHMPWNGWNETDLRMGPNHPPVADAGSDQSVSTLTLVTLDGSDSSDPDGDLPLAYHWTQTGGPPVTLSNPEVVTPTFTAPSDPAVLTFTLAVTDSLGLSAFVPAAVAVTVNNQAPIADAGSDQSVDMGAIVSLDGSGSSDPDDDLPLTYGWTQTGGPPVALNNPAIVGPAFAAPSEPAVLTFTLVITDSRGLPVLTPDEVVVTVEGHCIYLPLVVRQDESVAAQEVHIPREKPAGCPLGDCRPIQCEADAHPGAFDCRTLPIKMSVIQVGLAGGDGELRLMLSAISLRAIGSVTLRLPTHHDWTASVISNAATQINNRNSSRHHHGGYGTKVPANCRAAPLVKSPKAYHSTDLSLPSPKASTRTTKRYVTGKAITREMASNSRPTRPTQLMGDHT
jgi:hypothetical protein